MAKLIVSLLNCDYAYLGAALLNAQDAGAESIHLDVMDGVYVNNLAFCPKTVQDLKKISKIPIDVHFELHNPDLYADMFIEAGADEMIFQMHSCVNPIRLLRKIRSAGLRTGIGINPADRPEDIEYITEYLDVIVIMGVECGFGNQAFEEKTYEKIARMRECLDDWKIVVPIAVDGGVNLERIPKLKKLGVDSFIVGSSVFENNTVMENVQKIRLAIK